VPDRPYGEESFVNNGLVDSKSYESYKAKTSNDEYTFGLTLLSTILEREQIVYWKFKNSKDDGFIDIVSRMKP
jgi:hypothetical protein